jgi:hypothetical protein
MPRDRPDLLAQHPPRVITREGRIALLIEISDAMVSGARPSREAELWLGSAFSAFLAVGGPLERHLRLGQRGSHYTAQRLAAIIREEGKPAAIVAESNPSPHSSERKRA